MGVVLPDLLDDDDEENEEKPAVEDDFYLWWDCWQAYETFLRVQSQWLYDFGGNRTGLNYAGLAPIIEWSVHAHERLELLDEVHALERGCLEVQNEQLKKEKAEKDAKAKRDKQNK